MNTGWVAAAGVGMLMCAAHGEALRTAAERRGVRMGAAAVPARLSEAEYAGTLAAEFNMVEPENATKFGPLHPEAARYNFAPADAVVEFAAAHGMAARGHTLVWHRQNPAWLTEGNFAPPALSDILADHVRTVVRHFAGRIFAWDVVNEAFNDDGTLRSTIWSDAPGIGLKGTAYIEQALRWAHEADPKALLFYNDYGNEGMNAKSDAVYKMAKDFKARGVPLDGIGLQMHLTLDPAPMSAMDANIKRLTALGLEVQITELDVRLPADKEGHVTAKALDAQARIYGDIAALCLRHPRCTAIQTWGFTDKYSWIPRAFPGTGAALIFDRDYWPKGGYYALKAAFGR